MSILKISDIHGLWKLLKRDGDLTIGEYKYRASIDDNQICPTNIIIEYKNNIPNRVVWLR